MASSGGFVSLNGKSLELHAAGPRGWDADEANDYLAQLDTLGNAKRFLPTTGEYDVFGLYDVRDFGTSVGTGSETADTDAFQACFGYLSRSLVDHSGGISGRIYIPKAYGTYGRYFLADTVQFLGGGSYSHYIFGDRFDGNPSGSVIQWTGDNDATMFELYGVSNSIFEDLNFNGGGKAGKLLWIQSGQALGSGFGVSTVKFYNRCAFTAPRGVGGICLALGTNTGGDTYQCDQDFVRHCSFTGQDGAHRYGIGIKQLQAGNTKNLKVYGGTFTYLETGVYNAGSGAIEWEHSAMAEVGTVYRSGGACNDSLQSLQVEGCDQFVSSTVGANEGSMSVRNCQVSLGGTYTADTGDSDTIIEQQGLLSLSNNNFYNDQAVVAWAANTTYATLGVRRKNDSGKIYEVIGTTGDNKSAGSGGPTGTSSAITDNHVTWRYIGALQNTSYGRLPKIVVGGTAVNASVDSRSNFFQYASGYAPIYDGSANNTLGSDGTNAYAQTSTMTVSSTHDKGGLTGALTDLFCTYGRPIAFNGNMILTPHPYANVLANGDVHSGLIRLEFTYGDFTAAAHNLEIPVGQFYKGIIRGTYLNVTQTFAGTGLSTLTAKLSTSANAGDIISATTILGTAPLLIGEDVGDLNTASGKFWEPAACLPGGGRFVTDNTYVYLRLDGDVNLSLLTAGKIVVVIEYSRLFVS